MLGFMKFRAFFKVLAAIAGVLLLVGTIGFAWVLAQSPVSLLRGSAQTQPTAAMFVSKQAPLMASLMVNPDRLGTLRRVLANPRDRASARAEFEQFQQGILGNSELDYARDVKPWIGNEVTAAITTLDVDRDRSNGKEAGYLLALRTKDAERSREFLQLFWQKRAVAGTKLEFEQYKGTRMIYGRVEASESMPISVASAVVGNRYVLFANSPKVLRDAINNVQADDLNLEHSSDYQTAIAALDRTRIGVVFLNLPQVAELTGQTAPKTDSSAAIALRLDRRGLIAETALVQPANSSVQAARSAEALKYIPATSPIFASGRDLDALWSGISQTIAPYGKVAQFVNQPIETFQKQTQVNLPQDVFNWVKGDYALGLVPNAKTIDWVFVADRSGDSQAKGIAHLNEIAENQGISTGALTVKDHPIAVWNRLATETAQATDVLEAQAIALHTTVGKYEIFASSIDAINAVLNAKKNAFTNNPVKTAPLEKSNGYLYIDWETAQPFLESRFPILNLIELAGQPLFEHLRSITVSNYGNQNNVQRGGAFIRLS